MKFIAYENANPAGELLRRLELALARQEQEPYSAKTIAERSHTENPGWPGDWEGRTMLAQVMLARVTGKEPSELKNFMAVLDAKYNEEGYLGPIVSRDSVNEQAMAGHSWLLRAFCELYEWKQDPEVMARINTITENLMMKTAWMYGVYPVTKESRQLGGGAEGGSLTGEVIGGWLSSTDIGCVFILLDGASHVYHITKDQRIYDLLQEMIKRFLQAELVETTFQTHATLSAVRGMLRFYGDTSEAWILEEAKKIFNLYTSVGMSENYANFNWFARPEWTEPCAIVDSYIVAMELWKYTKKASYLDTAHAILYNAIYFAQRHNGGFGCDVCTGAYETTLHPNGEGAYEAWWCCTMRGADGLSNAAAHPAAIEDVTLWFPCYQSGRYSIGGVTFEETTGYPVSGKIEIKIIENACQVKKFRFFCPSCVSNYQINVDGVDIFAVKEDGFITLFEELAAGQTITISFDLPLYEAAPITAGFPKKHTVRYGVLELAYNAKDGQLDAVSAKDLKMVEDGCFVTADGKKLNTLLGSTYTSYEEILNTPWQILFD